VEEAWGKHLKNEFWKRMQSRKRRRKDIIGSIEWYIWPVDLQCNFAVLVEEVGQQEY